MTMILYDASDMCMPEYGAETEELLFPFFFSFFIFRSYSLLLVPILGSIWMFQAQTGGRMQSIAVSGLH